jgi:hypothetical protein
MGPLLVTALVGVGVKIATDFLLSGAKKLWREHAADAATGANGGASFAATLDKARGAASPGAMTAAAGSSAIDVGLGDRSRVAAAELAAGAASPTAPHALAAYRRFEQVEAP